MENKKKLKVLHILIGKDYGGATLAVRLLCQYQMARGYDVSVLANNVPKAKEEFIKYRIKLIDDKGIKGYVSPLFDLFHLIYWVILFRREGFDIVHTQTVKAGFLGRLASKAVGVKTIIHSGQGYRLEGKFKSKIIENIYIMIERFLSNITDVVIVPSLADYNTALRHKIVSKKKLRLVHYGIDISDYEKQKYSRYRSQFRNEIGVENDDIVIGTVARLNKAKGHEYLIDASARLLKKNKLKLKIVFVGDGPEKDCLMEKIKSHGLGKYFLFLGHRSDISKVMSGIDIHVLPSVREGFGIALLEAMAAGKPCVTTDVGGPAEAVEDGITGFVVPPNDSKSLAGPIECLIKDKNLFSRMRENAVLRVYAKFTCEVMGNNISDIYGLCSKTHKGDCYV